MAAAGAGALILVLATRSIGPQYRDGMYTVDLGGGAHRVDTISLAAASRFDSKRDVRPDPQEITRLQIQGIDFTEEEVNSKIEQQLLIHPPDSGGVQIDRVFLELHPQGTTAYLYTTVLGIPVTFSAGVIFKVVNESARAVLSTPHAGKVPVPLVLPRLLEWTGNTDRVEQILAVSLPPQVTGIQPREGSLHVAVNVFRLAANTGQRAANGALCAGSATDDGASCACTHSPYGVPVSRPAPPATKVAGSCNKVRLRGLANQASEPAQAGFVVQACGFNRRATG